MELEGEDLEVNERDSLHEPTLSNVQTLQESILQTSLRGFQKESILMLNEATSLLLKSLKQAAERAFGFLLGSEEFGKCFSLIVLYHCNIPESKNIYAARHGVERQHLRVRCHNTCQSMVKCRGSSGRAAAETTNTPKRVKEMKEADEKVTKRAPARKRGEALDGIQ